MVIDVTQKSFDQMISEATNSVVQAINEFEYSFLMDKYNYLQENGVIMEEAEENNSIKTKIKKLIDTIIQKVKDVLKWIKDKFNAIKSKLTGNKKKEAEDAVKESEKEASEAIDDLNRVAEKPNSESGEVASSIFDRFKKKQEGKAKKFSFDKDGQKDPNKDSDDKSRTIKEYEKQLERAKKDIEDDKDIIRNLKRGISEGPNENGLYKTYLLQSSDGKPLVSLERIQDKLKKFELDLEYAEDYAKYLEEKLGELR